jgi:hypothetical protein
MFTVENNLHPLLFKTRRAESPYRFLHCFFSIASFYHLEWDFNKKLSLPIGFDG